MKGGRGVQNVVRDLQPLACRRARIQPHTRRSSSVLVAAPNNISLQTHISSPGLCQPVNVRSCSRSPPPRGAFDATTAPALAAATRSRIPQDDFATKGSHPRSTAHLATLIALAAAKSRKDEQNLSLKAGRPPTSRLELLRHAQSVAVCV